MPNCSSHPVARSRIQIARHLPFLPVIKTFSRLDAGPRRGTVLAAPAPGPIERYHRHPAPLRKHKFLQARFVSAASGAGANSKKSLSVTGPREIRGAKVGAAKNF